MKEFLLKQEDGSYTYLQSNSSVAGFGEYHEIPKGMNFAYKNEFSVHFTKLEMGYRDSIVVWQRDKVEVEVDYVNQPSHYVSHPSGIECIEITRHHDFSIGNAIKYLWRAGLKDSDNEIQDLEKAVWYIQDKIKQLRGE